MQAVLRKRALPKFGITGLFLIGTMAAYADGAAGLQEATDQVKSYFDAGVDLMYAVGAVLGLIGAVKV